MAGCQPPSDHFCVSPADKTAAIDKGEKKWIYQDQLKVTEYYWFDPFEPTDCAGFSLRNGTYEPILPDEQGRLISQRLGLALVQWHGVYEDIEATWLRWATLAGELLPTGEETAEIEWQRAEAERQRADLEAQRAAAAEAEAARLRALLAQVKGSPSEEQ